MSSYTLFTSESVSEGHPDKVSDQVSDAILDLYLAKDPNARVAVETLVKTGMAVVAGEVTSSATVTPGEIESAVRSVICDIGYDSSDVCFDGNTCAVINAIGLQSADIAMGTQEADEASPSHNICVFRRSSSRKVPRVRLSRRDIARGRR